MQLNASELILNPDSSIYHLNLLPSDIAQTIITVGDPNRVARVSRYFDTIEVRKQNREFCTHTGSLSGKRLTVISTGIGTDNIDIVLNELDALVNIDFQQKAIKEQKTILDIIRVGTSGSLQAHIPVDSFLMSEFAIGFDGLMHFYNSAHIQHHAIQEAFLKHTNWAPSNAAPYVVNFDYELSRILQSSTILLGFTATNTGFYGPQGRVLRLEPADKELNSKISSFNFRGMQITNMEMETSGIYGLARLLGHRAVSLNCILANRSTGEFSKSPLKAMDQLIEYTLNKLTTA